MDPISEKLDVYAQHNKNVLMVGTHGIGKTERIRAVATRRNIGWKYFSAPTLDPYVDVIGLPVPDKERKVLEFYRQHEMLEAELLVFDELNRAHPKVLNAILELVQFKSINGIPLPKLRMVWGAINPPGGEYQVEELDPALVDRFHVFLKIEANLDVPYLSTKMSGELAKALFEWWTYDCGEDHRKKLTPRRMEYIGSMIHASLPWRDCLPLGDTTIPHQSLQLRLDALAGTVKKKEIIPTKEYLVENREQVLEELKNDPHVAIRIHKAIADLSWQEIYLCRDIIERMPKDLVEQALSGRLRLMRSNIKGLFLKGNYSVSDYPKIFAVLKFDEL